MHRYYTLLLSFSLISNLQGQQQETDSLKNLVSVTTSDSLRIAYYRALSDMYSEFNPDSAFYFARLGLDLAKEEKDVKRQTQFLTRLGNIFKYQGGYLKALEYHLESLKLSETINYEAGIGASYNNMAEVFKEQEDFRSALEYYEKGKNIFEKIIAKLRDKTPASPEIETYTSFIGIIQLNIGDTYDIMGQLDSALLFQKQAYVTATSINDLGNLGAILTNMGSVYFQQGNTDSALHLFSSSLKYLDVNNEQRFMSISNLGMAEIFEKKGKRDSSLLYARRSFALAAGGGFQKEVLSAATFLSRVYEKNGDTDSAFYYQKLMTRVKDSIFTQANVRKVEALNFSEKTRQQELVIVKAKAARAKSDKLQYIAITLVIVLLFATLMFFRRKKAKTKLIEYSGVIVVLLVFEFLALFLHPLIDRLTNHRPIYMLLALCVVAAILTPLHHRMTHWIKHKFAHHHPTTDDIDKKTEPVQTIKPLTVKPKKRRDKIPPK